ncbi:MAG: hypothetical protein PHO75_04165 [Candidatus Shapirobacteria bacterium]|nr:hypothetical protein [Candidatus Shapirobacteria bacterium]
MLPKEEKIKNNSATEQPGLFDKENEKERIFKKRKFVYIVMFLTIGLSLSFKIYSFIKKNPFSLPKIPTFNFNVSSPKVNDLNLPKDQNATWSIFFKKINSDSIIFQQNQNLIFDNQNLESILTKINTSDFIIASSYSSSLPEGFKIKEIVEEKDNTFSYFSTINTPNQELLLIIKINDSKDLSQSKKLIPTFVDQLYWYSLQK